MTDYENIRGLLHDAAVAAALRVVGIARSNDLRIVTTGEVVQVGEVEYHLNITAWNDEDQLVRIEGHAANHHAVQVQLPPPLAAVFGQGAEVEEQQGGRFQWIAPIAWVEAVSGVPVEPADG